MNPDLWLIRLRWTQTAWALAAAFITYSCFERQGWSLLTVFLTVATVGSTVMAVRAWILTKRQTNKL
jgi:hypothetical protein